MALTHVELVAFKPKEKSYKRADGRGLYIEVRPNGSKLWRFKYRMHGAERRISLGKFPEVSLAEAREQHEEMRTLVRAGKDPVIEGAKRQDYLLLSCIRVY